LALLTMFGSSKTSGPYIEYFPHRKALLIRGSADQVKDIKEVLRTLGENDPKSDKVRILTLDQGSASTLAEAIQKLLPKMRGNPVKAIVPATDKDRKPEP